jgi:hypothetical protein
MCLECGRTPFTFGRAMSTLNALVLPLGAPGDLAAQNWPQRVVRIIVPYAPRIPW